MKDYSEALQFCDELSHSAAELQGFLQAELQSHKLTLPQWRLLLTLYQNGPMKSRTIAEALRCSDGNVSYLLNNLVRRGLIERCRNQRDRRQLRVALTAAGRNICSTILPEIGERAMQATSRLSGQEQAALKKLCHKLLPVPPADP